MSAPDIIVTTKDALSSLIDDLLAKHRAQTLADFAKLMAQQADPLLSITAAAEHLGLTVPAFRQRLSADASLAALRIGSGRMSRFRRSDLTAWASAAKSGGRKGPPWPTSKGGANE